MGNLQGIKAGDTVTHHDNGKTGTVKSLDHTRQKAVVEDSSGHAERHSTTKLNGPDDQGGPSHGNSYPDCDDESGLATGNENLAIGDGRLQGGADTV